MLRSLVDASYSQQVSTHESTSTYDLNSAPVIGIVSQPLATALTKDPRFDGKTSYIMQAYVNWLETAGARVVPIIMTDEQSVTDEKLSKVNAVLFPGGAGNYRKIGEYIYK